MLLLLRLSSLRARRQPMAYTRTPTVTADPSYTIGRGFMSVGTQASPGDIPTPLRQPTVPATNPPGYVCSQNTPSTPNVTVVDAAGSGTSHPNGFTGGGQAGYNLQSGGFVYGVEVDFGALNLGASKSGSGEWFVAGPANFTTGSSISTDWLFTTRARLGMAISHVLIYATGGLAVTDLHVHNSYQDDLALGGRESSSNTDTKAGWTVGGGLEMALDNHWSFKGEYLFVNFNDVSTTGNITNPANAAFANPLSVSEDLSVQIARAGINYRF